MRLEGVDLVDMDMVNKAAEAYLEDVEGSAEARLRFLRGLWAIQAGFEAVPRAYEPPAEETAREALVTGQPLFLVSPPPLPLAEYLAAVERIAAYVADESGIAEEQADALRDAAFSSAITADRLETATAAPEGFVTEVVGALADDEGPLKTPTVAFVLISALVPFMAAAAEKAMAALEDVKWRNWDSGSCPVCGAAAAMGRMGECSKTQGADRVLWCGLCHTEWSYDRLRCTRCGDRNPGVLRYSYEQGDPAHRLHLCDTCKGYLKVVFSDELRKPLSMTVEDGVTSTLDAIARSEGYAPAPKA